MLTVSSTAELSAGLICTCLPTIPAIVRRPRNSRSGRTPEKNSQSRRTFTRKQPTNSSDQDPFNREYFELSEGYSQKAVFEGLPAAVATDIEGGKSHGIQDTGPLGSESIEDEILPRQAIVKTVVVEQSRKMSKDDGSAPC